MACLLDILDYSVCLSPGKFRIILASSTTSNHIVKILTCCIHFIILSVLPMTKSQLYLHLQLNIFLLRESLTYLLDILVHRGHANCKETNYLKCRVIHIRVMQKKNFWISFGAPSTNVPISKKIFVLKFHQFGQKLEVATEL